MTSITNTSQQKSGALMKLSDARRMPNLAKELLGFHKKGVLEAVSQQNAACKQARMLFVDDEPELVNLMGIMSDMWGYTCKGFTNPKEALEHFKTTDYDVAILDYRMKEMNGIELARELKKINAEIPILLATGNNQNIDPWLLKDISKMIGKPYRSEDMQTAISSLLESAKKGN